MGGLMTALRFVHIAAGTIGLFVAPAAMVTAKGGRAHRRWGKIYFWSMATVIVTALALAMWRPNYFLVLVAVFSFYQALSGYRVLWRKGPSARHHATLDWVAAGSTLAASFGLISLGLLQPGPVWQRLGVVAVVFGLGGVILAGRDVSRFMRPPTDHTAWIVTHMTGMLGSYVATITAFSVVNFTVLPLAVRWLWPTVVGTPLIALWVSYYRERFRRRPTATALPG